MVAVAVAGTALQERMGLSEADRLVFVGGRMMLLLEGLFGMGWDVTPTLLTTFIDYY